MAPKFPIDRQDVRILNSLQNDSSRPIAVLADEIGLSTSACHRRIRILEEREVISGYQAALNPVALGLALDVFVDISLSSQDQKMLERFESSIEQHSEILACWLMAGAADYRLHLMAKDMADFDRLHRTVLADLPGVASMQTQFVLRKIKRFAGFATLA